MTYTYSKQVRCVPYKQGLTVYVLELLYALVCITLCKFVQTRILIDIINYQTLSNSGDNQLSVFIYLVRRILFHILYCTVLYFRRIHTFKSFLDLKLIISYPTVFFSTVHFCLYSIPFQNGQVNSKYYCHLPLGFCIMDIVMCMAIPHVCIHIPS